MRILFYVQSLLGTGHTRRIASIANACARAGHDTHVASGNPVNPGVFLSTVAVHPLPEARTADATFSAIVDAGGVSIDDTWRRNRRDRLEAVFNAVDPEVLVVELFPFGRRSFAFELVPLLSLARTNGACRAVVSSVRDIIVSPRSPAREEECLDRLANFFDTVIVHGDPALVPFPESFPAADRIFPGVGYSGYVSEKEDAWSDTIETADIVVSVGGGAVGQDLLRQCARAAGHGDLRERSFLLLTGSPAMDQGFKLIEEDPLASNLTNVTFSQNRPDFRSLLASSSASISQAGYNTVCDIIRANVRAVLIPFSASGRETEQPIRAAALARYQGVHVCPESELSPETISRTLRACLSEPPPDFSDIDIGGAEATVSLLEAAFRGENRGGGSNRGP